MTNSKQDTNIARERERNMHRYSDFVWYPELLLACMVKTQVQLLQLHEASLPGLTAIHTNGSNATKEKNTMILQKCSNV